MKVPNYEIAEISEEKINSYLLSLKHPIGRSKAKFFFRYGFRAESWALLAQSLVRHLSRCDIQETYETAFGIKYIVEGSLETPDGKNPLIRAIWLIKHGEIKPQLITAYPIK